MHRDKNGLINGDLNYGGGEAPITVLSHIPPLLYPCVKCNSLTIHIIGEQPCGVMVRIPFFQKPLASTNKGYHLLCNDCTVIARQLTSQSIATLERRTVSREITAALDSYFSAIPKAPRPYSTGFTAFYISTLDDDAELRDYATTILSVYAREDGG